jgi:hypothetical protein
VRIEGLLAAFPKLVPADPQHTFVETDAVRYVYQPLEQLYLVLLTTRNSNIMEDLDTLHLLAKVVQDQCRTLVEEEISRTAYELIFAFDEVIHLGYKEKVTPAQVRTFLEMDSHEEKIWMMVEKNKQREAKEEAKRRQHQIERERAEAARSGRGFGGGMGGGMGSGSGFGARSGGGYPGAYGSAHGGEYEEPAVVPRPSPPSAASGSEGVAAPKRGLQLKKASAKEQILRQIEAETPGAAPAPSSTAASGGPAAGAAASAAPSTQLVVSIEEKLVVQLNREGGLENMEVKGDLSVQVNDPERGRVRVRLSDADTARFQYKTHPNMNRADWQQECALSLKDPSKAFPAHQALKILRWTYQTRDERQLPLTVTCWPSPGAAGQTQVVLEYELAQGAGPLRQLEVAVPVPGQGQPTVQSAEGQYAFQPRQRLLIWSVPLVDQDNRQGSIEFSFPYTGDAAALFPIQVRFFSPRTLAPFEVLEVESLAENVPPPTYTVHRELQTESFVIA